MKNGPKDWRDVARELGKRFGYDREAGVITMPGFTMRIGHSEPGASLQEGQAYLLPLQLSNSEFLEAAREYKDRSDRRLISYLHSRLPLGECERVLLAELVRLPPKDVRSGGV